MVSIAGSKKMKRQMAPTFWGVTRKEKRFVVAPRPGPHPKDWSVPSAVLLRDMLEVVYTLREAKAAIYGGKVKVDGVVRKSLHHGIGLMDVVELDGVEGAYRMVPMKGKMLQALGTAGQDASKKIVKVTSKTTIKGGRTALGTHDGRTIIISDQYDVRVGDSCLLEVPSQDMLEVIPLQAGCRALVIKGANAGESGTISSMEKGTFSLPRRAVMELGGRSIQIPADAIIATGKQEPAIRVSQ